MRHRPMMALAAISSLALLSGCGGGGGEITIPPPPAVIVSITPPQATVRVGAQLPFQATVQGSTNIAVGWQVNGVPGGTAASGLIDSTGLYTAPATLPTPPNITVTVTWLADATKFASASVTVTIGITVLPTTVSLNLNTAECPVSQQFTATITGSNNASVNWNVNGVPAGDGNATFGTITKDGLYIPPVTIPNPPQFNVNAISQVDITQSAAANVNISAGGSSVNQLLQSAPIELGTSGGNATDQSVGVCCSGTLGSLVTRNGTQYILSNNHVLARSDAALVGEAIVQPGLVDTQCVAGATVARFSQAVKLQNASKTASADAALARVVPGQVDSSGAILQLGAVSCGLAQPALPANTTITPAIGMAVAKSGRSTGLTCGTIGEVAVDVQVHYSNSCGSKSEFIVTFANQVVIESQTFAAAGDSGSLIVDAETAEPTALLFGGDPTTGITIANPIQDVLRGLADPSNHALPAIVGGSQHTVAACAGAASSSMSASTSKQNSRAWPSETVIAHASSIKDSYRARLGADPAVLGVGVGAGDNPGEAAIVVFVERGKSHRALPVTLDGVPVKVKTIGQLRAFTGACAKEEGSRASSISLP